MLGWKLHKVQGGSMQPLLPEGTWVLFRKPRTVVRSDVVLVDHPEHGLLVRKVSAISVNGRVGLRGISRCKNSVRKLGNVDHDRIVGTLALKLF